MCILMEPTKFQIRNVDNYINKIILISNNKNKDREGNKQTNKQTNKQRKKQRKEENEKERE